MSSHSNPDHVVITKRLAVRLLVAAIAGGSSLPSSVVSAQDLIDAADPAAFLLFLKKLGFEVEADPYGRPYFTGRVSRSDFTVFFRGCENDSDCTRLEFSHEWDSIRDVTLEDVNAWNFHHPWGQAYLTYAGGVAFRFNINLEGGVTEENLKNTIGIWNERLVAFEDYIGWTGNRS